MILKKLLGVGVGGGTGKLQIGIKRGGVRTAVNISRMCKSVKLSPYGPSEEKSYKSLK